MAQQRPALTPTMSAFDFDVVTDTPKPPSRRPDQSAAAPGSVARLEERAPGIGRAEPQAR